MRRFARVLTVVTILVATASTAMAQSPSSPASPVPIGERSIVVLQLSGSDGGMVTADQQATAARIITTRLDEYGAPGTSVSAIPDGRIRIDVGEPALVDAITRVASAPGQLTIVAIPNDRADEVRSGEPLPEGMPVEAIVEPGHVVHAAVGRDEPDQPVLELTLDDEAARAFDDWTVGHMGELMALVLDDVVVRAATINAPRFEGEIRISGAFDDQAVVELVAILAGGPLPLHAEPLVVCPAAAACPLPSVIPSHEPGASVVP